MEVIARGAEAVLRKVVRQDRPVLVKERVRKGYRVPELDEKIRSQRTRTEERMLFSARRAGVRAPEVLSASGHVIEMEWITGKTVKDCLNTLDAAERARVCSQIGEAAARLHGAGIMHGDLTTSNMIINDGQLFVIDFGLARATRRVEDYAVDLFLLLEALKAAHFRFAGEAWKTIIKAYKYNNTIAPKVLDRLAKIERRRRYRGE
jgi:Kae1-associated kinase Bud32